DRPLDDRWELVGEYGSLSYLPRAETARLWRLVKGVGAKGLKVPLDERDDAPPPEELTSADRLAAGKRLFDAGDARQARAQFRVLMDAKVPESEDARF